MTQDMDRDTVVQRLQDGLPILDDTVVHGNLLLQHIAFKKLPERLHVYGLMMVIDCDVIEELPEGLIVEKDLKMYGCTALKSLPKDLKVLGNLYISGCPSIVLGDLGIPVGVKGQTHLGGQLLKNNKDNMLPLVGVDLEDEDKDVFKTLLAGEEVVPRREWCHDLYHF